MCEDGSAHRAGPHPEAGGKLAGHLWVASQVLPQAPLVHIELSTHRTRVVCAASLCWVAVKSITADLICRERRANLPGTPEALGSLWTNFMCSISSSPVMQSLLQMGQQLGLGPPTNDWCCKESHELQIVKEWKDRSQKQCGPFPDSASVKEKD